MTTIIVPNVEEFLKRMEAPRPHYLVGSAEYTEENGSHVLRARALFPLSDESIRDRAKARTPHVNVSNALYGVWNGIHIIAYRRGYHDTLASDTRIKSLELIRPDEEVDLEINLQYEALDHQDYDTTGAYEARYKSGDKTLMIIHGKGVAQTLSQ